MKKITNTTEEKTTTKTSLLKPFPFVEGEDYLLRLKNGDCAIAYWNHGQFYSGFGDQYVEEEIESFAALKELEL